MLGFLFKTHCLSFYGAEMWHNKHASLGAFKSAGISFHKAIKRILKISYRESNHTACELIDCLVFKHFINSKIFSFAFQIVNSKSECIAPHKEYLLNCSELFRDVERIALTEYGIENVFENDLDAIRSRIKFLQDREDRYIREE
jgi:hypothetical protein